VLDTDKGILRRSRADQFVKFDLNRSAVPVLRILNQEHHEKGNDGRAGVDDELPRIRESEKGASKGPDHYDGRGEDKGRRLASADSNGVGGVCEYSVELVHAAITCRNRDTFR